MAAEFVQKDPEAGWFQICEAVQEAQLAWVAPPRSDHQQQNKFVFGDEMK